MSSYTITIAADDPDHATTILRVEVRDAIPRISELVVRAGQGNGLTPGQVPAVDMDLLLRAIAPAADERQATIQPPVAVTGGPSATADPSLDASKLTVDRTQGQSSEASAVTEGRAATRPTATAEDVVSPQQASAASKASENRRARQSSDARATRSGGGKGKAAAKAGASSAATKTTKRAASVVASAGGRVYRRSPSDLEAVYRQAGNVAAVADHYNVPRHTAQGWIRTLRRRQAGTASE
ncbi:hypothetical protein Nm8I071_23200 [Nonomuraea sp. TT08I-71]|nr:hypothetical protein Nm8I071_23200 [Nonomuraea sp. TT08I-71]